MLRLNDHLCAAWLRNASMCPKYLGDSVVMGARCRVGGVARISVGLRGDQAPRGACVARRFLAAQAVCHTPITPLYAFLGLSGLLKEVHHACWRW